MHHLEEDQMQVPGLRNITVTLHGKSVRPLDDYFQFLDALCDPQTAYTGIQFQSRVGLGKVALAGAGLGAAFAFHFSILLTHFGTGIDRSSPSFEWDWALCLWSIYVMALCTYHMSEFLTTVRYNSSISSYDSFLLNQSKAYVIAVLASWAEFWLEALFLPKLKTSTVGHLLSFVGLLFVLVGQTCRTGAMVTAQSNFTHEIQGEKTKTHKLVTGGLYAYLRHPSYFGWFWWSIGTQLLVVSPICTVAYAAVSWNFFKERIAFEERQLENFFPKEYPAYKAKTPVGIPYLG